MRRMRFWGLLLSCLAAAGLAIATLSGGPSTAAKSKPKHLPWPSQKLELGMADSEGGGATLKSKAPFGYRYHYISAGVNTSSTWRDWANGNDTFASNYLLDARNNNTIPVFSYYQIRQSLPGASITDEAQADLTNIKNVQTMKVYFEDLRALFMQTGLSSTPVVVQVEPDLWGYMQKNAHRDDAASIPAAVSSTGMPELKGLPNNGKGLAQAVIRLRNRYAPKTVLGYHLSIWGTNKDIAYSNEPDDAVDALSARSVKFYRSLDAPFDSVFAEFADRDSGYAQNRNGINPANIWWDSTDFARHERFLGNVHKQLGLPIVLWQIPLGNTVSRSMNNTPYHYQDNRVQWLLDKKGDYAHLRSYQKKAGVVALMFGSGQQEGTHWDDAAGDGITNPKPITGNTKKSKVSDDDGGYFRGKAQEYYRKGAIKLR